MNNSTGIKQKEILNTQNNVEETHKSTSLVKNEQIKGTPFRIIGTENGWFIVMGDHKLTENSETEDEALLKLATEYWMIIMRMIARITEIIIKKEGTE